MKRKRKNEVIVASCTKEVPTDWLAETDATGKRQQYRVHILYYAIVSAVSAWSRQRPVRGDLLLLWLLYSLSLCSQILGGGVGRGWDGKLRKC